ncbi:MAG: hypothetical protein F7B61_04915 [Caldisphaeraceae archaeon]|nr:hypothetical protein [Caldisphaeraceae archaeon]
MKGLHDNKFGHVVKVILYLLNSKNSPTVSEIIEETGIPSSTFYYTLKKALEEAGWVEFRVNPDRTITAHLTQKGRKVAEALATIEDILKEAGVV